MGLQQTNHVLAEGLTQVAMSIESPEASLCVALFAPWGSGKTFFWRLIVNCLLSQYKAQADKIKKQEGPVQQQPVTRLGRCLVLAWAAWCWVARNFASVLCFGTDLEEEERVATMMVLTVPIGVPVWLTTFVSCLVVLPPIELVLKIVACVLGYAIFPIFVFFRVITDSEFRQYFDF